MVSDDVECWVREVCVVDPGDLAEVLEAGFYCRRRLVWGGLDHFYCRLGIMYICT